MKRRLLSIFLTLTMILLMLPNVAIMSAVADNAPWDGSGTEKSPYLIRDGEDLLAIANAVNSGDTLQGKVFLQMNDIDLEDYNPWPTIGITINNAAHEFCGVFNGGDWNISGLYVNRNDDDAGLFGYVGEDGMIKNVHVKDGYVSGTYWVGGIAGRNYGIVEYCSFSGEVYGSQQYAGGVVGDNHGGLVRYCCAEGYVEFNQIGGGVVGRNSGGTVENCYNRADVCSKNIVRGYAGGVVGENTANSTVENCYSDGWVDSNDDMSRGAIVGANGAGSTVKDCYYPEEFEEDGLPGVGGGTGTLENVTPKSEEQFASGEVAWELSQGKHGDGWGQTLNDGEGNSDKHPHFTDMQDKDYATTPIYRVRLSAYSTDILPDKYLNFYVDPHEDVNLPELPPEAAWFVRDDDGVECEFDGKNIESNIDAYAGKRVLFVADGEINHRLTYSPDKQTVDLDIYLKYVEGGYYSEGLFEYEITADEDNLNGTNSTDMTEINSKLVSEDKKTLIIPAGTNVKDGYTLKITAKENKPLIMPLALTQLPQESVPMTVKIIIEKATPVVTVEPTMTPASVTYGAHLSDIGLSGGRAEHSATNDTEVRGNFNWSDGSTVPTVKEAEATGYPVIFEPTDSVNYNSVTVMIKPAVNKAKSKVIKAPVPVKDIYNGMAEYLIKTDEENVPIADVEGGTLKFWVTDDPTAQPPDSSVFSSTIPSRANVGTYYVWYMVVGDDDHEDTAPACVEAEISPYELEIDEQVFYNGGTAFTLELTGVKAYEEDMTVVATLTTDSKNAGIYGYPNAAAAGKFTVELSNSNYTVKSGSTLEIKPLPVILKWIGELAFEHDGTMKTVEAEVTNKIDGDSVTLTYQNNSAADVDAYIAKVTQINNANYTVDPDLGAQNVEQQWRIFEKSSYISLNGSSNRHNGTEGDPIIYGDPLTLTAEVTPDDNGALKSDTVEFFVNGEPVGSADIERSGSKYTAALTIDNAIYNGNFSLGANVIRADYTLNDMDATTVFVDPKPLEVKITNTEKTYDGNKVAVGVEIKLEGVEEGDVVNVTADCTFDDESAADNKAITAANIMLSGAQSGNYTVASTLEATGRILPKPIKLEWRGVNGNVYTGDPVNVYATANETLPGEECEVIVEDGDGVDAGDYIARATVLNPNYMLPDNTDTEKFDEQPYIIRPADLYVPGQTVPYKDDNAGCEFIAKADGVTPTGKDTELVEIKVVTASSPNVGDYTYDDGTGSNTDENTYTASTDDTNYQIKGGALLTIEKILPIYTPPVPNVLVYSGSPQDLVTAEAVIGGTMQYSLSEYGTGTYYPDIPTGIGEEGNTVTVTVWYRVIGDQNHYDVVDPPMSVDVTIYATDDDVPVIPGGGNTGSTFADGWWDDDGSDDNGSSVPNSSNSPNNQNGANSGNSNDPNGSADPDSSSSGKSPNTGVEINFALYFLIMCGCATAIFGVFRKTE